MKLTVTIELDKDSAQNIQTAFSSFSKQIKELFGNANFTVEEEAAVEPDTKPATKPKKPATKKKSNIDTILKTIKKHKDGIHSKELQQETGLAGRLISDNVYRLKKQNKIEKTEDGMFVAL
jgi:hypothetical protein